MTSKPRRSPVFKNPRVVFRALLASVACVGLLLPAYAEGENDPLWNKHTYEKKIYNLGQRLLWANNIQERVAFRLQRRLQDNEVNAYAYESHATVVIEDGLLRYIDNDDEMAAVLGHEIAHIIRRHVTKSNFKRSVAQAALVMLYAGQGYGNPAASPAGRQVLGHVTSPLQQNYETEADLVGIDLMVHAGFNPLYMESVMTKISSDGSGVFRSHPRGTDRIRRIHEHIAQHYPQFLAPYPLGILPPGAYSMVRPGAYPGSPGGMYPPPSPYPGSPTGAFPPQAPYYPPFPPGTPFQPTPGSIPGSMPGAVPVAMPGIGPGVPPTSPPPASPPAAPGATPLHPPEKAPPAAASAPQSKPYPQEPSRRADDKKPEAPSPEDAVPDYLKKYVNDKKPAPSPSK